MSDDDKKLCSACNQNLSKENFSKKQFQAKSQRRCKTCVEQNIEISIQKVTQDLSKAKISSCSKKKKSRNKPVYAGTKEGVYKSSSAGQEDFVDKFSFIADDLCAYCGKVEEEGGEKLLACEGCKNVLYCSRTCQKSAHPEHKLVCKKFKADYKAYKKDRKARMGSMKDFSNIEEQSQYGVIGFNCNVFNNGKAFYYVTFGGELRGNEQPGHYFASPQAEQGVKNVLGIASFKLLTQNMRMFTTQDQGDPLRSEYFSDVSELNPRDQFLFSCGVLNDIDTAKNILPYVLHDISISDLKPDGSVLDIGDITVRGYRLNALEWASRKGNYAIAEWLATDERTKVMLTRKDSAPVAWACYTGKVELAKMLVKKGADSRATTEKVWNYKPPMHLAAENGHFLALKYLVEECGHDIHSLDAFGKDIRASIRVNNKRWTKVAGCVACDDYAKSKGVEGDYIK
ncbi:hypothetical protein CTEN210_09017 [Chaetoceros tenuissimus]|uniref:MYND-type domain-containing protein n=1 Tax=Chaetoceros tenuissimus TaxID=426638 RepID=A0AAD3CUK1_9STRA|nr:hypothetical protein CTEN210_09017 [Chaetoceros tenuissimus]